MQIDDLVCRIFVFVIQSQGKLLVRHVDDECPPIFPPRKETRLSFDGGLVLDRLFLIFILCDFCGFLTLGRGFSVHY